MSLKSAKRLLAALGVAAWTLAFGTAVQAELRIGDICRLKGQEENTLQGMGLVVGLEGTGDSDLPTIRALARMLQLMGNLAGTDEKGVLALDELKKNRNAALVLVTAKVPGEGTAGRETTRLHGERLRRQEPQGGRPVHDSVDFGRAPDSNRVYAFAEGPLTLQEGGPLTSAKVHQGCLLVESFFNPFVKDGKITLVLDGNHAAFQTAQDIEDKINLMPDLHASSGQQAQSIAKAQDQVTIEVAVPAKYAQNPVLFASMVLDERVSALQNQACVVVNERDGVIIIGEQVEIGPVAVAHQNLTIETGVAAAAGPFVPLDTTPVSEPPTTKLKAVVTR